jgi:hypothetical protein
LEVGMFNKHLVDLLSRDVLKCPLFYQ